METEYLLSSDGGATSKGPFPISRIRSMYLDNRICSEAQILVPESSSWVRIADFDPDLAQTRSASHSLLNAQIDHSEKVAIKEERSAIWKGLVAFIGGSVVTAFTYKAALDNPSGGTYVIAYGPVLSGLFAFIYGVVSTLQRRRDTKRRRAETLQA